jgi:hypothetical protein
MIPTCVRAAIFIHVKNEAAADHACQMEKLLRPKATHVPAKGQQSR